MWVSGSDCSLVSSTMTFDVVFLRSITAVTNTTDAAQVAEPLKVQLFCVFLYPRDCWLLSNWKPFNLLSNITTSQHNQVCACCTPHSVSSLHTTVDPCSHSMWLYPVPHVTRGNVAPLSSGIHPERRGGRIQLLFGPEWVQEPALSVWAANNWPPHAVWL